MDLPAGVLIDRWGGMVVGPLLLSWMVEGSGYRLSFLLNTTLLAAVFAVVLLGIRETEGRVPERARAE